MFSGNVFSSAVKKVWVLKGGLVYEGLLIEPVSSLRSPVVAMDDPVSGGSSGVGGGSWDVEDDDVEDEESTDGPPASPGGVYVPFGGDGSAMLG